MKKNQIIIILLTILKLPEVFVGASFNSTILSWLFFCRLFLKTRDENPLDKRNRRFNKGYV
jgi:hypothetical protein